VKTFGDGQPPALGPNCYSTPIEVTQPRTQSEFSPPIPTACSNNSQGDSPGEAAPRRRHSTRSSAPGAPPPPRCRPPRVSRRRQTAASPAAVGGSPAQRRAALHTCPVVEMVGVEVEGSATGLLLLLLQLLLRHHAPTQALQTSLSRCTRAQPHSQPTTHLVR